MKHVLSLLILIAGSLSLSAQTVNGTVLDDTKQPLIGAAVRVLGTTIGTVTDMNGNFKLDLLQEGKTNLEISFMGFQKEIRSVNATKGQTVNIRIAMQPSAASLNEVVVVGYGVQRKRDITSSIVKLDGKELTEIPTPSFENGLQGKASGVQVITGSGAAGSGSMVRVRGIASVSAGGDPLYVIDGIPVTQDYFLNGNAGGMNNNPLAAINPNDIESVEILKDAAATGIYGSRGSNGVILITTKRGKKKGWSANLNMRFGVSNPASLPNMMDSKQYLQMFEEAWVNDGRTGTPELPGGVSWEDAQRTNTNWVDEVVGTGIKQNYDVSFQNGTEKYNFYAGISHQDDQSYMIGNSYKRSSARLNGDINLAKWAKLSISSSASQGQNNRVAMAWGGGLGAAMSTALPIYPIYYEEDVIEDGVVVNKKGDFWLRAGINNNPVAAREMRQWRTDEFRSINSLGLELNPVKNLFIRANGSYDYMDFRDNVFEMPGFDPGFRDNETNELLGRAKQTPITVNNYNFTATANYLMTLSEKHSFNFLLGTEFQDSRTNKFGFRQIDGADKPFYEFSDYALSNNPVYEYEAWNFISYFGRVNYDFNKKYFFQVQGRVDGSSRFGPNNRFGFFPAASAGWIISEENFLKNSKFLSFLKLKTSYGINGNANIPWDAQYALFRNANNAYDNQSILFPNADNPGNPNLKWETSRTWDASVEFGFLNDRITGEIGYYRKNTRDMLLFVTSQLNTGFSRFWDNVGEAMNEGIEFSISPKIIDKQFKWSMEFNVAYNYNEVLSIGQYTEDAVSGGTNDTRLVVGTPIGTNFLVRFSHIDEANGKPVYLDINGNETYNWDPADRVSVGKVLPDAVGGWRNDFRYKSFDLSLQWIFVFGADIYDSSSKRQLGSFDNEGWNHRTDQFDRWQKPGDQAVYPVLTTNPLNHGSGTPWINTDLWLHDGSYARLRSVSFGYALPDKLVRKAKMSSARIGLVATNLITLTRFIGLDPEIARDFDDPTDRNMSPNITYLTPPQERTFNINLTIGF